MALTRIMDIRRELLQAALEIIKREGLPATTDFLKRNTLTSRA